MNIFLYDKTFEGLLTVVFDAYQRKSFPDQLFGYDDVLPLFVDSTYKVFTQKEKADRVWKALENKLSKYTCNMLTYCWLSEIEKADEVLYRFVCKVLNSQQSIEGNFGDIDVLTVHQIAKKVGKEAHYLEMFIRFQKTADQIYFSPISPIHNALPLVISHFTDRFSDQKWLIYDTKRGYGYFYDMQTVEEITMDDDNLIKGGKLDHSLLDKDEVLFQKMWKEYFKSMTIKERINLKHQKQQMPKRFWKYLTEKQ